jgi:hypothetical protein
MKRTALGSLVVAASVGAFYSWVVIQFWAVYSFASPIAAWLRATIPPREHQWLHLAAMYLHDALTNVVLAAPFAALLVLFTHQRSWLCLATAVLSALVVNCWGTNLAALVDLAAIGGFWIGIAMCLFSLPIAYLMVQAARRL